MVNSPRKHSILKAIVIAALALAGSAALVARLPADDEKSKSADLAKDLIGTWILVGTPDKVGEPPASGGRLKFRTGKHWTITDSDADGKVQFHHGGTYTLDGADYAETIKYANENTAELIGKTLKVKVEGDTYTQIGVDNPYSEVWKRAK
jgi:hypothetical protein